MDERRHLRHAAASLDEVGPAHRPHTVVRDMLDADESQPPYPDWAWALAREFEDMVAGMDVVPLHGRTQ